MVEIDWNLENTRILCKLLAEQVGKGNRPNTHLNALGYSEVEKGFKERTGLDICKTQIKNKWDKLKEDFKAWNKLMLKQTGTGWDNVKGTIKMDNEWWKKTRQEIPGSGKFKILGLQNKEELQQCFADITNDGGDHYCPMGDNVVVPPSDNQAHMNDAINGDAADGRQEELEEDEVSDISPIFTNGKRRAAVVQDTGKKPKTGTAVIIQEAVTSIATSANAYAAKKDGKYSIEEVMGHVIACGAGYETNEYYIASELFVKKEQREMFMTYPTAEHKFNWLRRKYEDKYGK